MNEWLVVTWANRDYHAHMIAIASQFAGTAVQYEDSETVSRDELWRGCHMCVSLQV